MKFCITMIFCLLARIVLAGEPESIVYLTSGLDANDRPYDKLTTAVFDPNKQFIMVLYTADRETPIGKEQINFNLSRFRNETGKYTYDATITLDIKPDWVYCYHPVYFNQPGEYKIVVTGAKNDTIGNTLYFDVRQ